MVNLNQCRGAAGVFNSKFFIDKNHRISFSNNPFPFSVNLTIFDCFSIILTSSYTYFVLIFFFLLNVVKYNFKINSPKKFVCNWTCFYIFLFWLVSIFFWITVEISKKTLVPKLNSVKAFQYATGIYIVYLPTIYLKCRYCKLTTLFTSMILFAFRKLT